MFYGPHHPHGPMFGPRFGPPRPMFGPPPPPMYGPPPPPMYGPRYGYGYGYGPRRYHDPCCNIV